MRSASPVGCILLEHFYGAGHGHAAAAAEGMRLYEEALAGYTRNGAWLTFEENE